MHSPASVESLNVFLVGDLILDQPEPDRYFDAVRGVWDASDVVAGHVEVPHTRRGHELGFDVPAPASPPEHLPALARAGFNLISLAGNHIYDHGPEGVLDTVEALRAAGLETCGAGPDLDAARRPAQLERRGRRISMLSFNCVGPARAWAGASKAGCAFVELERSGAADAEGTRERVQPDPGDNALDVRAVPDSMRRMQADIAAAASQSDVVIVSLHKGIVHTPAVLAAYERPLAHAAIDAGAQIVFCHHAHIARGVECHRGRPVFHGLGNFVTVTRALSPDSDHPLRQKWALTRLRRFGFTPDPDYPTYPFHPESKNSLIAACVVAPDGQVHAGFIPCWIGPSGRPEPLGRDARGRAVADYVIGISRAAGLQTSFGWDGDRVVFQ